VARILTEALISPAPRSGAAIAPAARAILICAAGLAAAGTFAAPLLLGSGTLPMAGETEFTTLLRFMALMKAAMALGAAVLICWRLKYPASRRLAVAYIIAAVLMAAAPGLIWHMTAIWKGAALFHAGLVLFLILAWADGTPAYRGLMDIAMKRSR
jgi:hypothetical protein